MTTSEFADATAGRAAVRVSLVAATLLMGSLLVAWQRPVPTWETRLTRWINDVPDGVATLLWLPMQLGTVFGPLVAAAAIGVWRRDSVLALAVAATGVLGWFAAKLVKSAVERGRPLLYLPDIIVREGSGAGLGFVSGHSTVAACIAVFGTAIVPRPVRWLPVAAAVIVGLSRVVYGMHLPADVVGGWALGTLLGFAGLQLVRHRSIGGATHG